MKNKKIALLSVYNKDGIAEFAKSLISLNFEIWSSGGTAKHLSENGIVVKDIAQMAGKPILGHKVVTLSRQIHAGLLADRNNPAEIAELETEGISPIDLVCVDLYPLENAISEGKSREEVIALTDIGGPTMLSSASKGGRIVVSDSDDRERVITWMKEGEKDKEKFLQDLQAKADLAVSMYRMLSAGYHSHGTYRGEFFKKIKDLRYGENPNQANCAFFAPAKNAHDLLSLDNFKQIEGAEPSMINLTDLSGAVNVLNATALALKKNNVWEGKYIAVVAKHGTPCGLGVADSKKEALERMVSGDPLAAFGGAMLANFPLDEDDANILKTFKLENGQKRIYDLIAVPDIDEKTTELLARKDDKCRIFVNDTLADIENIPMSDAQVEKQVRGGIVVCDAPRFILDMASIDMTNHSGRKLSASELADLCIAHSVCALSKSNTVTLVKDGTLLANASGQQSRVQCVKLALMKLQEFHPDAKNFTAASDSFFPFTDGPELLIDGGASTIFATSGSKADEKVIELMLRKNINFITIPDKTGRLFYGH